MNAALFLHNILHVYKLVVVVAGEVIIVVVVMLFFYMSSYSIVMSTANSFDVRRLRFKYSITWCRVSQYIENSPRMQVHRQR